VLRQKVNHDFRDLSLNFAGKFGYVKIMVSNQQTQKHSRKEPVQHRKGFTLVELLITMMVIMIISGLVLTAVGGNDGQNQLNSGISRADSIFSLARSTAISRKSPVRVLVCNDSSLTNEYLRFLAVYRLVSRTDDGGPQPEEEWEPIMLGEYLPSQIYVDIAQMNPGDLFSWNPGAAATSSIVNSETITTVAQVSGGVSGNWIVFDFHANGTAVNPMRRFVVGRALEAANPLNVVPSTYLRAGFTLFRSGKVVHFQSPQHLLGES
jgi:prepilin-type N-terminal cleavage/methylation domain-containing protein